MSDTEAVTLPFKPGIPKGLIDGRTQFNRCAWAFAAGFAVCIASQHADIKAPPEGANTQAQPAAAAVPAASK